MNNVIRQVEKHKNDILLKLMENENIARAVAIDEPDFQDEKYSLPNPYDLLYTRLFPYKKVPGVLEEQKTFITLNVSNIRPVNRKFAVGTINFFVFTHVEGLMQTNYGITRTGFIAAEIHEDFNENPEFGIGKLALDAFDDLEVNDHFFGIVLQYQNYEFD